MSKLKSKSDVIEWYWPDFLNFCMTDTANDGADSWPAKSSYGSGVVRRALPTIDNFWLWYITDGPLGVKHAGRYYTKDEVEYV